MIIVPRLNTKKIKLCSVFYNTHNIFVSVPWKLPNGTTDYFSYIQFDIVKLFCYLFIVDTLESEEYKSRSKISTILKDLTFMRNLTKVYNIQEYNRLRCFLIGLRLGASKRNLSKGPFHYYRGILERNYGTTAHVLIIQHYDQFTWCT